MSNKGQDTLQPRRHPTQQRAKEKTQQILDTTAQLLEEVGVDDLTTILIAKKMQISVGSLYHYFPNKHAILYALGAAWLQEMTTALEEMEHFDFKSLTLVQFAEQTVDKMFIVYKKQRAILPLAQALWSIPKLRDLDIQHDQRVIAKMTGMFVRLGFQSSTSELNRLSRAWLELTHALLLVVVDQEAKQARRTLNDLKRMVFVLLEPHQYAAGQ